MRICILPVTVFTTFTTKLCHIENIAKGTTDPRVEFRYTNGHITSSYTNLDQIASSEISTKHQLQNLNQTSAFRLNLHQTVTNSFSASSLAKVTTPTSFELASSQNQVEKWIKK